MRVRIGRRAGRIADSPRQRAVEPCRDTAQSEPTTQKIPRHLCKGELWCEVDKQWVFHCQENGDEP